MDNDRISIHMLCNIYRVEEPFIRDLQDYGLIEFIVSGDEEFLPHERLDRFERIIRLHQDLDINLEGLDVINRLLERIHTLEEEIRTLRNGRRI